MAFKGTGTQTGCSEKYCSDRVRRELWHFILAVFSPKHAVQTFHYDLRRYSQLVKKGSNISPLNKLHFLLMTSKSCHTEGSFYRTFSNSSKPKWMELHGCLLVRSKGIKNFSDLCNMKHYAIIPPLSQLNSSFLSAVGESTTYWLGFMSTSLINFKEEE